MRGEAKHAFLKSIQQSYGLRLRRFVSARLRNAAADTSDLMQEIYLRLLRIDNEQAIRNPQAYLFTVARHVLHQHALRQSTGLDSISLVDFESQLPDGQADPAVEVETDQAFEELGRSLQQRSPRAYATLIMSRCEGLPLQEIGERLGVSRDQVKKYLARALLRVRAVGTQFGVYRKPVGTTITIVEGKVAVTELGLPSQPAGAAPILLSAGEQLTLTPGTTPHAAPADIEAATAWTRHKLIFMETPLSEAVAELNRYNARQITIEGASLSEYHIRGSFEAGDPERLLRFLRERFNADVREHGNEIRVSRK